jgi:hypothetical protein
VRRGDETGYRESTEVGEIQVRCGVGTLVEVVVDAGDGAGSSTHARGHRRLRRRRGVESQRGREVASGDQRVGECRRIEKDGGEDRSERSASWWGAQPDAFSLRRPNLL